jgi:hypothetical protein
MKPGPNPIPHHTAIRLNGAYVGDSHKEHVHVVCAKCGALYIIEAHISHPLYHLLRSGALYLTSLLESDHHSGIQHQDRYRFPA